MKRSLVICLRIFVASLASGLLFGHIAHAEEPRVNPNLLTPPQVSYENYRVTQLYFPKDQPKTQTTFTLVRNSDVVMVVENPERWFGHLFTHAGKPDPRAEVNLDVIKSQRAEIEKQLNNSDEKIALVLEKFWRDFVSIQQTKRWLEQSCFFVIEGKRFEDIRPIIVGSFPEDRWNADGTYDFIWHLRFHPHITEKNRADWIALLSGWGFKARPVTVTLGQSEIVDQNTDEMPTDLLANASKGQRVQLQIASPFQMISGILVVGLLLVAFLLLATRTTLLQDFGTDELWHMSLGRSQMAFWFLVILISYIFLWIVIGDYHTLTKSELLLLGISATTGLGASVIADSAKASSHRASYVLSADEMNIVDSAALAQLLERMRLELFTQRTKMEAETDTTVKAELQQEVRRLEQRLDVLKKREVYFRLGRQSWLKRAALDLVQETDSPSLHRFQMMAWTLLLGLVFLDSVYFKLAMAEFDASLLTLIGISNGAYLGFKFQTSSVTTGANL